ncbi:uncharacterized protein LOC130713263 [Lotus japonicus]|uniref:uncharacterized protein LOC130713263 n=1 Tax=Lotus japonicus TaxID=34305 RepID=UPI002583C21D|nr:uncharacterized protein LOC130713263 [Lotus japonicus]
MSRSSFIEKGDPSSKVQVIISSSSDHISTQTQEPTPIEAQASVNTGVEQSSLKQELHEYALRNEWHKAKSIYEEFPEMVRIPLTSSGDTALHVAVSANSTDFMRELVNFEHVTQQDLELRNAHGHTALCLAAITWNRDVFQIMIQNNENLALIHAQYGMLAVHLAALTGYHEIVQDLSSDNLLQKMDFKDIQRLFFMTINSSMYDVATDLVQKYTEPLIIARNDEENLTALHMLARKPSEENKHVHDHIIYDQLMVFDTLWARARETLEYKNRLELITEPSIVLFDAVKSGKLDFVKSLLYMTPELLPIKDPKNGQSLLHIAEVEMGVPPELSTMRNKDGKTPNDLFHANHRKLSDEVKDTAKGVATYNHARSAGRENGDDTSSNLQVVISSSSDPISTQTQQEPAVPEDANLLGKGLWKVLYYISKTVDKKSFWFTGSLKGRLHDYALLNWWFSAKPIYEEFPDMVRIPLTASGDTALHVAVSRNSIGFVEEFVNFEHVTQQDLELRNGNGNTAFCIAAVTGNRKLLQVMIQKNENLALIHGQDGMLPVHLAALGGYHEIVEDLSSENLLEKMDVKDIQQLLFMAINSDMYDVATKLVKKYPEPLLIARDDKENLTALHMLARKPHNSEDELTQLILFSTLLTQSEDLQFNFFWELITKPSVVLFDAVKSGNFLIVKTLLFTYPELLAVKDPKNEQNILHIAVLFRQNSIFDFILKANPKLLIRAVDEDRNNILHLAACQQKEASLSLRPDIRMRRELAWFKEVEKRVPPELRAMKNKDGKTPNDMFYANHRKLSDEVKETAKGVANSAMVVAALVVTVAFAAALTTPGDKNNAWFSVFIITNAVALFTSSLAIVSFLSIFTSSRFKESHFVISLYPNLIIGKLLLFISVITMVMAFAAATFLIFDHIDKGLANVVASFALLTIIMFLGLQLNLFDGLVNYFVSRYI